jgi:DNA damage-binding protein 1
MLTPACRAQAEKATKGAVYNLNAFQGKLLAGVNNKVVLYNWKAGMDEDSHELVHECSHAGHILALYVTVRGDFIMVGDLMKSMTLLIYKPEVRLC